MEQMRRYSPRNDEKAGICSPVHAADPGFWPEKPGIWGIACRSLPVFCANWPGSAGLRTVLTLPQRSSQQDRLTPFDVKDIICSTVCRKGRP